MSSKREDLAKRFGIVDYIVFTIMLVISISIGLVFAFTGSRQRTAREFLIADRKMGILPITLSLMASFISAVGLLGIPVEIYLFGTSYWMHVLGYIVVFPVAAYCYMPVFYNLRLTSSFEYLEKRFNKIVRRSSSAVFLLQMTFYMALVTYAPSLALSHVTGIHVWASVGAMGVVCIIYTTLGGIKAVMWTDAFQSLVMACAMLTVIITGLLTLGGFQGVWDTATEGQRIASFDFDPNPLIRHTFWSLVFGSMFTWISVYGVNQTQVQRYLSAPSKRAAEIAIWLNFPCLLTSISLCCFTGIVLYAKYATCDPVKSKLIGTADQMLPLYVMETLSEYPGLPGFFVSGIFSGSLSTLSSGLNSLAAVTLEDYIRVFCLPNLTEERAGLISKLLALGYGIVALALVAVIEQLGSIMQVAVSLFGLIGGPMLGIFSLGMFFPWANGWGALTGMIVALAIVVWIALGANFANPPKPFLPISTSGCDNETYVATNETVKEKTYENLEIYKLSYQWYSGLAFVIVIIIGLIVSFASGYQKIETLDFQLLSPPVKFLIRRLPPKAKRILRLEYEEPLESEISISDGNFFSVGVEESESPQDEHNLKQD